MEIISIGALKGGTGKTITAVNLSHILAAKHGKRVLLVDNDKQGNASRFYNCYGEETPGIAEIMLIENADASAYIKKTEYAGLDIIPANMSLYSANKTVLLDETRPQQTRIKAALSGLESSYDFVIIDNAPDLNMSVINALAASHFVIVPMKIDSFAIDGFKELLGQMNNISKAYNPALTLAGCLITMYQRNNINEWGISQLKKHYPESVFNTHIRNTVKVSESTLFQEPLLQYAPKSTAAQDYAAFTNEILENIKSDRKYHITEDGKDE